VTANVAPFASRPIPTIAPPRKFFQLPQTLINHANISFGCVVKLIVKLFMRYVILALASRGVAAFAADHPIETLWNDLAAKRAALKTFHQEFDVPYTSKLQEGSQHIRAESSSIGPTDCGERNPSLALGHS
jgi:hypothetical protein